MLLTDQQINRLIEVTEKSVPSQNPFQVENVVRWGERVALDMKLLQMTLDGLIQPTFENGEVKFHMNPEVRRGLAKKHPHLFPEQKEEEWPQYIDVKGLLEHD
jgi:hypothetical protein